MKFEFRPVRKKIDLGEYAEEMAGAVIQVRVNVDRETIARMRAVNKDTALEDFYGLMSELWGVEDWPVEDVRELHAHCRENDPQLWNWITSRTAELVWGYQAGQKKE